MKSVIYTREEAEALVAGRSWWYHRFEIFPGVITPGVYDGSGVLAHLGLDADLKGQRILEIGPADGFFTKQLTMRGASVTAYDYIAKNVCGFAVMEQLHGMPLNFVHGSIYDIEKFNFEPFDLVLCMGVMYHLPDMVRAIHLLRSVCKKKVIIETVVAIDLGTEPRARYHPADSFNRDYTNFWSPNIPCVEAMLVDAGFVVDRTDLINQGSFTPNSGRAVFWCTVNDAPGASKKTDMAYPQAQR